MSKSIFLSKVFWLNSLAAVISAVEMSGLSDVVPAEYQSIVLTALAVGNIILRLMTHEGVYIRK